EPSCAALMMFKVLLLQRWYGLSDPAMEAALFDRMSFLRFAGLSLEDTTPDHSTIWRFRERLAKEGLIERLFGELERQLDGRGLLIKQGTLIDASMGTSAARRPRKEEGPVSETDPDARFGADNERHRFTFGYKLHIAVDQGSGLIRNGLLTSANIQDISVATALLPADAGTVYADRGYHSKSLREHLRAHGFGDGAGGTSHSRRRRLSAITRSCRCAARWRLSSAPSSAATASRGCATSMPHATLLPICWRAWPSISNGAWPWRHNSACCRPP